MSEQSGAPEQSRADQSSGEQGGAEMGSAEPNRASEQVGDDEHPGIAGFRAEHQRLGGTGRIVVLPDAVHTAALAAEALGCEVGAIANSLVFETDGGPVLVLTSGAHRVDVVATAARIGVPRLKRASPEFVREHTGQVIGGVSPLAHPVPVPTYLDRALADHDVVWAAAGHPAAVFSTTHAELLQLTGATPVDVGPEVEPEVGPEVGPEAPA